MYTGEYCHQCKFCRTMKNLSNISIWYPLNTLICHMYMKINDVTVSVLSSWSCIDANQHVYRMVNQLIARSELKKTHTHNKEVVCSMEENVIGCFFFFSPYLKVTSSIRLKKPNNGLSVSCWTKRSLWTFVRSNFDIWQIEKRWLV